MVKNKTEKKYVGMFCDNCKKKTPCLVGNYKLNMWCCNKCDGENPDDGELEDIDFKVAKIVRK